MGSDDGVVQGAHAARQSAHGSLAQSLMLHPNFESALRLYVKMTLDRCNADLIVTKLFGNATQHVAFSLIATLAARAALIEGATPPTPTRLIQDIMAMGLSNHGKVESLLNRMVDQGLIERKRSMEDGRFTFLHPTQAFWAMDAALNVSHGAPAALLVSDPIVHAVAAGDREAMMMMRTTSLPSLEESGAMLQRAPQILHFVASEAGWLILLHLVEATWRDDVRGRRYEAIAQKCAVTRPHVRSVLVKAHEYGLLAEESSGVFMLTSSFEHTFRLWIAEILASFITCCVKASRVEAQESQQVS